MLAVATVDYLDAMRRPMAEVAILAAARSELKFAERSKICPAAVIRFGCSCSLVQGTDWFAIPDVDQLEPVDSLQNSCVSEPHTEPRNLGRYQNLDCLRIHFGMAIGCRRFGGGHNSLAQIVAAGKGNDKTNRTHLGHTHIGRLGIDAIDHSFRHSHNLRCNLQNCLGRALEPNHDKEFSLKRFRFCIGNSDRMESTQEIHCRADNRHVRYMTKSSQDSRIVGHWRSRQGWSQT